MPNCYNFMCNRKILCHQPGKECNNNFKEITNLKSMMKPYDSTIMPKAGQPMRTRKKPNPKAIEPCKVNGVHLLAENRNGTGMAWVWRDNIRTLWFLGLGKNCTVGFSPMVSKTPEAKRIWQHDKQKLFSVNRTLESRMSPNNSKNKSFLHSPLPGTSCQTA